jgi:hypothetical protein
LTEVLDVRAVQNGSWWMVSVPGMPGLLAQVSSLEPRLLGAALASGPSAAGGDISVRRVVQVEAAAPAQQAALGGRSRHPQEQGAASSWAQHAMRATRLAPRRVAELLAS